MMELTYRFIHLGKKTKRLKKGLDGIQIRYICSLKQMITVIGNCI